jgi:hypothetical protein
MAYETHIEETLEIKQHRATLKRLNSAFLDVCCALSMDEYGLRERNPSLLTSIGSNGGTFAKINRTDPTKRQRLYPQAIALLTIVIENFDRPTTENRFTKTPVTKETLLKLKEELQQNLG